MTPQQWAGPEPRPHLIVSMGACIEIGGPIDFHSLIKNLILPSFLGDLFAAVILMFMGK